MELLPKPPKPFIDTSMDRIAIPRAGPLPPPATRRRLERACQACCDRKIRCNGERPTCRHCLNTKANCVYHSNRLEEDKDALQQLKSQNEQYKSLLEKIAGRVRCIAENIDQVLGVRCHPGGKEKLLSDQHMARSEEKETLSQSWPRRKLLFSLVNRVPRCLRCCR